MVPSGCGSQALSITYRSVELPGKATWKEGKEKIKARCHWLELEEQRRAAGAGIWGWGLAETRGEEDVQCLEILALHCLALPFQAFLQTSRSKSPINAVSWVFFLPSHDFSKNFCWAPQVPRGCCGRRVFGHWCFGHLVLHVLVGT